MHTAWDAKGSFEDGWQSVTGSFVAINAFTISCRCAKAPLGAAPSAHLGDGCLDLVIVHKCSHRAFLQFLVLLSSLKKPTKVDSDVQFNVSAKHLHLPFVEVHRVKELRFEALDMLGNPIPNVSESTDILLCKNDRTSVWCIDGEILARPNSVCRLVSFPYISDLRLLLFLACSLSNVILSTNSQS